MSNPAPFDPTLVTQSVNYHGHNLLKQLVSENAAQIHTIKLQDIDYFVYQNRLPEIRTLGSSRVQEVIEFIASKSSQLLVSQNNVMKIEDKKPDCYKDRYQHQLPFEYFLSLDRHTKISELIKTIEEGDILFTEICSYIENRALLKLLAFDGGKHRDCFDIRNTDMKFALRLEDTIVSKTDEDKFGRWLIGTRLKVEVIKIVEGHYRCIYVGTKGTTISKEKEDSVKLGKILISDLPPILSVTPDPTLKYLSQCVERMDSYKNPQSIKQMVLEMQIDLHLYPSLMPSLSYNYAESDKAKALRKAQMCKWAHKSVADGVTHFKKGQHEEAFQCLNKALQIDPENVEAFVAKGALLANLGRYEKAIDDFERSLKYNPNHPNARKYMCETLVELGKQLEEKNKEKEAEKCYARCLELNKDHSVAKEALNVILSKRVSESESLIKVLKQETIKKEEDFLSDLLEIEMELNKKKNDEENAKILLEAKDEVNAETEAQRIECLVRDIEAKEAKKEASLSPLSQKLAMQQNLWAPPPHIDQTMSYMMEAVPPQDPNVSMFSNPPPNWPLPDVSKPPPAFEYSEDPSYRARVEQFLKELETRSVGPEKRRGKRSREKSSDRKRKHKDNKKRQKRQRSRSSISNSSSSDGESSRSSMSNSSSGSGNSSKKSKKHRKKKTKKNKKSSKKRKETTVVPEMPIPDFEDLEEKLMAYYKKMEAINSPQQQEQEKTQPKPSKPKEKTKKKSASVKKVSKKKSLKKTPDEGNSLKMNVHPAFMDSESEEELPPKDAKLPSKNAAYIVGNEEPSKGHVTSNKKKKKVSSSSSFTSSASKSRSRSSRSSRSRSRGKRGRHSRSRSRSRGRSSYRHRRKYSRSRSRSRSKYSAHYHRPSRSSRESYRKHQSKSPPIGYYNNKPFYPKKYRGRGRGGYHHPPQAQHPLLPKQPTLPQAPINPDPPQEDTSEDPKPPPIKFEFKKKINAVEEAKKIHRHLAMNEKADQVKGIAPMGAVPPPSLSPDPSSRFGKWASEGEGANKNGTQAQEAKGPGVSLDQFESFLKKAKEKSFELMKERNKAFLKPDMN